MRAIVPIILALALIGTALAEVVSSDDALLALVSKRSKKLVRVTQKPRPMPAAYAGGCTVAPTTTFPFSSLFGEGNSSGEKSSPAPAADPHQGKFFHVYMSDQGVAAVKDGKNTFPEGTLVLKEKYSDSAGKKTELFTGMLKREKGFNPEGGDWEYFVVSGDAKKILQRGKIESCVGCHSSYQSTDFVTREYTDTGELSH